MSESAATSLASQASADPGSAPETQPAQAAAQASDPFSALDEDGKKLVLAKGWKGVPDVLKSYHELEQAQLTPNGRKVVLPDKPDDADGWSKVYERLGRPATPDAYKLEGYQPPADGSFDRVPGFREVAHKAGITQAQAEALFKWDNETWEKAGTEAEERFEVEAEAEMQSLKSSWGQAADENLVYGKRLTSLLGWDQETLGKVEKAIGTKTMVESIVRVGRMLSEGKTVPVGTEADSSEPFGLTPQAADGRIEKLLSDPSFAKRYFAGEASANREIQQLHRIKSGEGALPTTQPIGYASSR